MLRVIFGMAAFVCCIFYSSPCQERVIGKNPEIPWSVILEKKKGQLKEWLSKNGISIVLKNDLVEFRKKNWVKQVDPENPALFAIICNLFQKGSGVKIESLGTRLR